MRDNEDISALGDELAPAEHELGQTLAGERPAPAAGFRGALGRHLALRDPGYGPRPERLRAMVAGLSGAGLVLLAVGLLQATGSL
jgi:hypothetical protein